MKHSRITILFPIQTVETAFPCPSHSTSFPIIYAAHTTGIAANQPEKKEKIKDTGELTAKLNEISIESAILNEKFMNYKARYEEISSEYERLKNEKLELDSFFSENRNLKEELSVKNKEILDTINKKDKENSKLLEEIKELELEIRKLESGEKELISKVKDVETKIILNKNEHVKYVENFTK